MSVENKAQEDPRTRKSPSCFGRAHSPMSLTLPAWLARISVLDVHHSARPCVQTKPCRGSWSSTGGPDGHLGDGHRAAGRPAAFTRSCPCGFTESQCCIHDTSTFQPICRGPDRSQPAQGQLRGHPSPGSLDPGTQNAFPDFLKGNLKPQGSGLS